MTGAELATALHDAAALGGWRYVHFRPGRTSKGWRTSFVGDAGYPDVTLARAGRVVALELKGDRDPVRPGQAAWLDALGGPGGGSVVGAGFLGADGLDTALRFLVGRASEDELRAALRARWSPQYDAAGGRQEGARHDRAGP